MVRLNLSSDEVRNCKKKKKQRSLKKGIQAYKQGFLSKKSKEPDKFRASETRKSVRNVSKTGSSNKF